MDPFLEKVLNTNVSKRVNNRSEIQHNKISFDSSFFTKDKELFKNKDYITVMQLIKHLWETGVIIRGSGFCFSMCDIVKKMLKVEGISCKLVECDLMICNKNRPSLSLIGLDHHTDSSYESINSHVVCITETEIPMIIDLSLFHFRDLSERPFICERICEGNGSTLAYLDLDGITWEYNVKQNPILPELHQQSILDRIKTDSKIFNRINYINKLLIFLFILTSLNFVRGVFDFSQKYLIKDNGFGPEYLDEKNSINRQDL